MERIAEQPFAIAFGTLFVIVMLRANATYWLGRGALRGGKLSQRFAHRLEGPTMQRAQRFAARLDRHHHPLGPRLRVSVSRR